MIPAILLAVAALLWLFGIACATDGARTKDWGWGTALTFIAVIAAFTAGVLL